MGFLLTAIQVQCLRRGLFKISLSFLYVLPTLKHYKHLTLIYNIFIFFTLIFLFRIFPKWLFLKRQILHRIKLINSMFLYLNLQIYLLILQNLNLFFIIISNFFQSLILSNQSLDLHLHLTYDLLEFCLYLLTILFKLIVCLI